MSLVELNIDWLSQVLRQLPLFTWSSAIYHSIRYHPVRYGPTILFENITIEEDFKAKIMEPMEDEAIPTYFSTGEIDISSGTKYKSATLYYNYDMDEEIIKINVDIVFNVDNYIIHKPYFNSLVKSAEN